MPDKRDLTGMRFGKLVVTGEAEAIYDKRGRRIKRWYCNCDCGTKNKIIREGNLLSNGTKSCGCNKGQFIRESKKRYNEYDLTTYEYGIGYLSNTNEKFYFDLEDYDKIKNYCWLDDKNYGYVVAKDHGKLILLHRLIMGAQDKDQVDHISHNLKDNRKTQLRLVNHTQNMRNTKIRIDNTSGVPGVYFDNKLKQWRCFIMVDKKKKYLGCFRNFYDAVMVRKEAENKYYGQYSYDASLEISERNKLKEE